MMRKAKVLCCALIPLLVGLAAGCKRGPSEEEMKLASFKQQLVEVKGAYAALQQARSDLAAAEARKAELEAVAERRRSDEEKAELEELTTRIAELTETVNDTDAFQNQLTTLLTTGLNDFPSAEETKEALQIYSEEALVNAAEYVAKAGKYKDAIELLSSAQSYYEAIGLEPYQPVLDRIAQYAEERFVTQERFDQLKKNMTMEEVKAVVGVPYYANIQVDERRGVTTWLYRHQDGGAAALYFKTKSGKLYSWKWEAIKPQIVE